MISSLIFPFYSKLTGAIPHFRKSRGAKSPVAPALPRALYLIIAFGSNERFRQIYKLSVLLKGKNIKRTNISKLTTFKQTS